MSTLWNDLRHGARRLARRPALTLATLLVLALGLGATAALFSLVNGLLLKPLPGVEESERLVLVGRTQDGEGFDTFGYLDYRELRRAESLSGLAAARVSGLELGAGEVSRRITGALVTGEYFSVLGTSAAAGRLLLPRDAERPGAAAVAVLGHELATELFGAPGDAPGRTVAVNGVPLEVVGVAPPGFRGHEVLARSQVWLPITLVQQVQPPPVPIDLLREPGVVFLSLFGRLAPGATPERAEAELSSLHRRLAATYPDAYEGRGVAVAEGIGMGPGARTFLRGFTAKLLGVVLLVLVVVCANVANLQLARVTDRRAELGVRLALGANRRSLVRQILLETVLLAVVGGGLGLLLAWWSGGLLDLLLGASSVSFAAGAVDLAPDGRVFAFGLGLTLAAGLLAGVAPALHATRADVSTRLRRGSAARGGGRSVTRDSLVVGQIALSLVVLAAAGLYLRSLAEYRSIDPGFDAERVWTAGVSFEAGDSEGRLRATFDRLIAAAEGVSGVEAAAVGFPVPLGGSRMSTRIRVPGHEPPPDADGFGVDFRDVSPGYFDALGLTVLQGRGLRSGDGPGAERVVVVNRTLAERFWPGESPVGQTVSQGADGDAYRIVGVVSDMKYLALDEEPRLHMYRSFAQNPARETVLHVRAASGDPREVGLRVRRAVDEAAPGALLFAERTLGEQLDRSIGTVRVAASLSSLFGALALLLAAVGLAGTLLYYVRTHRHEIGVRMALGADAPRVVRLVVARGLRQVLLGLALGVPAALLAARALRSELYGVGPGDPWNLAAVASVLLAVALAATLPAATRASRARPAEVLRQD